MMKNHVKGFSLIEVLIAIAITAVIAASAFGVMNQALKAKDNAEVTDARLAEIQRALNRIATDFQQFSMRQSRNSFGDRLPVLSGDKSEQESFVSFTRQGKRNPANLPRSELERITYKMLDDQLIREQWIVLDLALESQALERPLLTGLIKFEVEFYVDERWIDTWPDTSRGGDEKTAGMSVPSAVKMVIELKDQGEIIQIYPLEIGG